MIAIVWEFAVKADAVDRFLAAYGPEGDWVALFRAHPGYGGTSLLRDRDSPDRFLTVDRWESAADFERMKAAAGAEYARLDRECEGLTASERNLGTFEESGV